MYYWFRLPLVDAEEVVKVDPSHAVRAAVSRLRTKSEAQLEKEKEEMIGAH